MESSIEEGLNDMVEQQMSDLLTRADVAIEDTWDLTRMFASDAEWDAGAEAAPEKVAKVVSYRGRFAEGPSVIREAVDALYEAQHALQLLVVYAALRRDEDQTAAESIARYERAVAISINAGQELAFVQPELVSLPGDKLREAIESEELADFRHMLENLERQRAHVLTEEVESVLAQMADVTRAPSEAFSALDNADIEYGTVQDEDGNEVTLTKGRYGELMESRNREVRRLAAEKFAKPYVDHTYTLASLHGSSVRKDVVSASLRGYESAQQQALFDDNIPVSVYSNLTTTVRESALPVMARYLELRRRALGVDELKRYDLRVPLAPESRKKYSYRDAVEIVLSGLDALGEHYVNDLREGFNSRWVDVHETKGKRSGAYSWGAYGAPPVMLMNWNSTLSDVFTLAHEAGHSMHSFYAEKAQPIQYADYSIFLAEIASTVNEVLLSWHLLNQDEGKDPVQRFSLLNRFADTYVGTVIRQTMFAEFEQVTHAAVEAGNALTPDVLSAFYSDLSETYTPGVDVDEGIRIEWGRIPHFYSAFYVYQYATGLSSAINLATAVRDEGEPARKRYLDMLSAGSSDYPMNVLKRAGVDLETPAPIQSGVAEFDRVVSELESLADEGVLEKAAAALEAQRGA
jgi:oligoendopeptidase F